MNPGSRTGGIVLCGGESSRMGQPKAWLHFHGETMLGWIVRQLLMVVEPVIAVAAPGQSVPSLPTEVEIARDSEKGNGPLQGLAAGLTALQGKVEAIYLSSCDVPFLKPGFVRRMIELLEDHQICVPRIGGRYHPLAAVYRMETLPVVETLLAENRLRPFFLFEQVSTRVVEEDLLIDVDPTFESLRNLNTPEEYQNALAEMEMREQE